MVRGLGNLGSLVLDQLVREPDCSEIVVLGRDHEKLRVRSNLQYWRRCTLATIRA